MVLCRRKIILLQKLFSISFFPYVIRINGYGVIQEVEELTKGRVSLGAGTLYGALQTMQKRGWIRVVSQETESRRRRNILSQKREKKYLRQSGRGLRNCLEMRT